jgi:hypothetical protein
MGTSPSSNQPEKTQRLPIGKKTQLHEAAERGESEELQRLLDTGAYDVNEEDGLKVCGEKERERGREGGRA